MTALQQTTVVNRILSRLHAADFAGLAPLLEAMPCPLGYVLVDQDVPVQYTYFLESGVASIVPIAHGGRYAEGGIIGREGYVVPGTLLGSTTLPYKIEMQIAGFGYRVPCVVVSEAATASATLRDPLLRFAQALMVQTTYSVLANAVYNNDERLARWLLMCHDRSDSDDLALTHAFMATMLSVRRSSVTTALHVLEGHCLVGTDRGYVTIRNRAGLEVFAGDCYGKPEAEYARLLGPL